MIAQENSRIRRALVMAMVLNVVLGFAMLFLWRRSPRAISTSPSASSGMPAGREASAVNPAPGTNHHDAESNDFHDTDSHNTDFHNNDSHNNDSHNNDSQNIDSQNIDSHHQAAVVEVEPPLAKIQLTSQRMQSIGVKLGTVERKSISSDIRVSGNVEVDERGLATVQSRFSGWIRKVFVDATYDHVRKGQPLFTIYSPDLVTTETEYLLARKNQQELRRSSVADVAAGAETLVNAAKERLQQWEVPQSEIAKLEATGEVISEITINSPSSGYITERNVLPNMYVQPETRLYSVSDLSTVWVYAQIFQTDVGRVKPGEVAIVTVDAYPGKTFKGRVDFVLPQVDMSTRTARARLVFSNPGMLLKPGMFVNVALQAPLGKSLTIPASSVFHSGTRNLVFISKGGGNLEPREVELGVPVGDDYVVRNGLKEGESLVTSANFLIDSEAQLQAAAGAFAPPPEGVGAAAPKAAPSANAELTTAPSPPRKGSNVFRIKLTAADGSAVSGAQVTMTFFMAAMPAMGMAAVKTSVDLAGTGGGLYEGKGDLSSAGSWQVTITARQSGNVIATRQLTVNAAGGM